MKKGTYKYELEEIVKQLDENDIAFIRQIYGLINIHIQKKNKTN